MQKIDIGTGDGLHDIEITPGGTIFTYTYGTGQIFKSADEGTSWDLAASLDSIYFEQIQFLDDENGWICGEYGKIYFTDDGGLNWQDRSVESLGGNLLLYGMLFEDTLKGMVSGAIIKDRKLHSKIYSTIDGGKNWNEWQDPPQAMILNLEKSPRGQTWGSGDNSIVKYHDGKWETIFRDTARTTGQIRDLEFLGPQTIIGISFKGQVLLSSDGGQTWIVKSLTQNRLRSIASLPDNKLLVAGDRNEESGHLFISIDAGASWTILEKDLEDIHRIAVSGPQCWLVGKNGLIRKLIF